MKKIEKKRRILLWAVAVIMAAGIPVISSAGTKSDESTVYRYLTGTMKINRAAACGVMTNLQAESGMRSNNVENLYNARYAITDAQYTARVNQGKKKNGQYKTGYGKTRYFTKDYFGYGICQWTSLSRRNKLLKKAVAKNVSIDNLPMQLEFLGEELRQSYPHVWTTMKSVPNNDQGAYLAAAHFCIAFEVPANTNRTAATRGSKAIRTYWKTYTRQDVDLTRASYLGLCGYKYPTRIKKGGSFTLGGHAIGNRKLRSVSCVIKNSKGKAVRSKTINSGSTAMALSRLSKHMKFNKLGAGKYTITIWTKDIKGRTVSARHAFTVAKGGKTTFARGFSCSDRASVARR